MRTYLKAKILDGMFSDERVVEFLTFDGSLHQCFAFLSRIRNVFGAHGVQVEVLDQDDQFALVRLANEVGTTVKVSKTLLMSAR